MSQRCNLSTSAVRDSVSARKPPIQPTPITPASTVFTERFLRSFCCSRTRAAARRHPNRSLPPPERGRSSDEAKQSRAGGGQFVNDPLPIPSSFRGREQKPQT